MHMLTSFPGYEEEPPPENYYASNYRDDNYTPSPPQASGGFYYPENNQFPPPPTGNAYTQQTTTTTTHGPQEPPIPPYNPADYAHQSTADAYAYPARGDHVSRELPVYEAPSIPTNGVPYFPPPPTDEHEGALHFHTSPSFHSPRPTNIHVALNSDSALIFTPLSSPEAPHNKSVNFAPLSPSSSRRLARIHDNQQEIFDKPKRAQTYQPPVPEWDDNVYDDPSSPPPPPPLETSRRHHHRRKRRNSDPSSDRPYESRRHRHRQRNPSRSPSPAGSDETVILPDRFDRDGRPVNGTRGGGRETEMVERIVHDFGDVVDGRKSWRDLLAGFMAEAGAGDKRHR
jgi:hypothetical protein